jgi:hypothetical protein
MEEDDADNFGQDDDDEVAEFDLGGRSRRRPIQLILTDDDDDDNDAKDAGEKRMRVQAAEKSSGDSKREERKRREVESAGERPDKERPAEQRAEQEDDDAMAEVRKKYGEPSVVYESVSDPESSFARWNRAALKKSGHPELFQVEVSARRVTHLEPVKHEDHVTTTILLDIPDLAVAAQVLALSDGITYNRRSHQLSSLCAGWKTNLATLLLAVRLAKGETTLEQIKRHDALSKMTRKAAKSDEVANRYERRLNELLVDKSPKGPKSPRKSPPMSPKQREFAKRFSRQREEMEREKRREERRREKKKDRRQAR